MVGRRPHSGPAPPTSVPWPSPTRAVARRPARPAPSAGTTWRDSHPRNVMSHRRVSMTERGIRPTTVTLRSTLGGRPWRARHASIDPIHAIRSVVKFRHVVSPCSATRAAPCPRPCRSQAAPCPTCARGQDTDRAKRRTVSLKASGRSRLARCVAPAIRTRRPSRAARAKATAPGRKAKSNAPLTMRVRPG